MLIFLLPISSLNAQSPDVLVRAALTEQTSAWNKSDIPRFAATYAKRCTLIGTNIRQVTHAEVLAHYRQKYPSPAKMGHLTFSALKIAILDDRNATAVGYWHLDRDSAAGGPVGGVFSLVFQKQNGRWLIVLDHTS